MIYDSFCLEMIKVANPYILKYLTTYRPEAAKSALQREFGLLQGYLSNKDIPDRTALAVKRRLDDLNRADYLIDSYASSLKQYGKRRTPDEHLRKGFQESLTEKTKDIAPVLNQKVMTGAMSKQDAQIALKTKLRQSVPSELNKNYVEHFDNHILGVNSIPEVAEDKKILSSLIGPDGLDAKPEVLNPLSAIEKSANVKMKSVSGSAGRNKSGLAISKKTMPIKSVSAPIVTAKLRKRIELANKKSVGSLSNIGMSEPQYLGKLASVKDDPLPGLRLLTAQSSKRSVKKPSDNLLRRIRFSFKRPELLAPPKTKLTKYLEEKGFK